MQSRFLVLSIVASSLALGCAQSEPIARENAVASLGERQTAPLGPDPAGNPARYPIVLVPGFATGPGYFNFYGVADALRADGHVVYEAVAPPFQTADVRAEYLAQTVTQALDETGADKVNLIGHSMGGLDGRALISTLGYGNRVASLTTISTPHRGSYFADVVLGLASGSSDAALNAFAQLLGENFNDLADDADLRDALRDISETYAQQWNDAHPDDPNVAYASWAGVSSAFGIPNGQADAACWDLYLTDSAGDHPKTDVLSPLMAGTAPFVGHGLENRPNDGLVMVESAQWGAFFGCIPADHADEVGQIRHDAPDAITGFDHRRFYRNIAFQLASDGF
jgi:triacylglycerol lipase